MDKVLQNYYTREDTIKDYMVSKIDIHDNDKVLEPSAGTGEFIESVLSKNNSVSIDAFEINDKDIKLLNEKYPNVHTYLDNTLTSPQLDKYAKMGYYNKIIGNPPYGGWLEYSDRKKLKKKYGELYVKETYLLFLVRAVQLLSKNGTLSFIIPDTYLYLNTYKKVRKFLFNNTLIDSILIFPSKFFPGVDFQYSNLSIITLKKCSDYKQCRKNTFSVLTGFREVSEIAQIDNCKSLTRHFFNQGKLLDSSNLQIVLNDNVSNLLKANIQSLGDVADCVTGIYTGDNKRFISIISGEKVKLGKGYTIVDKDAINSNAETLNGTDNEAAYVPLIKGATVTRYVRPDNWAIDWSKEAVHFYNENKKARFQNSTYYFRKGIAVPMLKSSKLIATEMNHAVFDQSIVGIFVKNPIYSDYILGLLNSNVANKIIHAINPTVNNSANYLKRLPVIIPSKDVLDEINNLVSALKERPTDSHFQNKLNCIFDDVYSDIS